MGDAAAPIVPRTPSLVGRDAELASVERLSVSLLSGAHGLVVLGEPGIGKTLLWRHGVAFLREAGYEVLLCRPAEEEMPLAAGGLADLLDGTDVDVDALKDVDDPLARGRAVLESLRALARRCPVVVAIDDVQWLDSVSARALRYALRRLDSEPVGVLAAVRASPEPPDILSVQTACPRGAARCWSSGRSASGHSAACSAGSSSPSRGRRSPGSTPPRAATRSTRSSSPDRGGA